MATLEWSEALEGTSSTCHGAKCRARVALYTATRRGSCTSRYLHAYAHCFVGGHRSLHRGATHPLT